MLNSEIGTIVMTSVTVGAGVAAVPVPDGVTVTVTVRDTAVGARPLVVLVEPVEDRLESIEVEVAKLVVRLVNVEELELETIRLESIDVDVARLLVRLVNPDELKLDTLLVSETLLVRVDLDARDVVKLLLRVVEELLSDVDDPMVVVDVVLIIGNGAAVEVVAAMLVDVEVPGSVELVRINPGPGSGVVASCP